MKIGIMGLGFVGTAMKNILESKHELWCYDPFKEGYDNPIILGHAEIIFLCVGTPMNEDNTVDMSQIEAAISTIIDLNINVPIFIKSTIPPGTCNRLSHDYGLKIGSNPELLRERCAVRDLWASDRIIMGGTREMLDILKKVYYPIFEDDVTYIELTATEAEMVKHTTNAFLASQVGFANEIYNMCQKFGIEYNNIKEAIYLDERLGRHISVPGTDGKFGFGGHCLPKDLNALVNHSKESGYEPKLFEELLKFNEEIRNGT